ncbi:MAG: ACP phosphodiesterase [Cyanobacteria bacterium J06623_7]
MNWLAHLLLAEQTPEGTLGNLLGDLVKGEARKSLSLELQKGIACHQAIDIYTDSHAIVKCSKNRIGKQYRRFAGILTDVFYDHILANNWHHYYDLPLEQFTTTTYASWSGHLETLPIYARGVIQHMIVEDWLASYATLAGIETTLARISWRLNRRRQRNYDLTLALAELVANYQLLERDFQQFFPQLQSHLKNSELSCQDRT